MPLENGGPAAIAHSHTGEFRFLVIKYSLTKPEVGFFFLRLNGFDNSLVAVSHLPA